MARPTKQGIDYFPLDCKFDDKTELYLLEKEAVGLAVLITLWQIIYQNEGYYIVNNKDLYLLVKKEINVDINEVESCINLCFRHNVFCNEKHENYGIITSKAIQKRYFVAAKKKKIVRFDIDYIINGVNVGDNGVNVGRNATKEEEEEEVKEEEKEEERFALFWKMFPSKNGKKIDEDICRQLFFELCNADIYLILKAVKNYADSEQVKNGIGIKDPANFIKNNFWKNWIEPEVVTAKKKAEEKPDILERLQAGSKAEKLRKNNDIS